MSSTTAEIIEVCEALPADKQAELAEFARLLLARQDVERGDWLRLSAGQLAKAYSDAEPEYTTADLRP